MLISENFRRLSINLSQTFTLFVLMELQKMRSGITGVRYNKKTDLQRIN